MKWHGPTSRRDGRRVPERSGGIFLSLLPGLILASAWSTLAASATVTAGFGPAWSDTTKSALIQRVAVFGEDNREPLPDRLMGLADRIGLLVDQGSGTVCTAFCASEDIVVTSSHCVYSSAGRPRPRIADLTFRAASAPARSLARIAGSGAGAGEQNIVAGSHSLNLSPPIAATSDWALLRLDRPACRHGGLKLAVRSPREIEELAKEKRVYHAAYHRDFKDWQLAVDETCEVKLAFPQASPSKIAEDFAETDHLVLHTCDTGGASSGSPLLVDGPEGPEVLAINAGTYVHSSVNLADGKVVHRTDAENVANTAIAAGAFADALGAFERASIISTRIRLQRMQELLANEGYFNGPRDGHFSPDSRTAVQAFEQNNGLPVTGLATVRLLSLLDEREKTRQQRLVSEASTAIETGSVTRAPSNERYPATGLSRRQR